MLYYLSLWLADDISALNVLRYITFRTGGAIMTTMLLIFLFGPAMIRLLKVKQGKGQPIRDDGPESHFSKAGTPTMGGLMMLGPILISTLLWADPANPYIWAVLFVLVGFGAIGFYDDYLKVTTGSTRGFPGKLRLTLEALVALVAVAIIVMTTDPQLSTALAFPFFKDVLWQMGPWLFIPFAMLVIIGAGNAVNLTDGLDGLAIVPVMIAAASFGLIVYLVGHAVFADYLQLHFVRGVGELAVIAGAMLGAGLGFLWYNAPPAQIFMGDTGSLSLGGALGAIAVAAKHEIVLAI
ncbi:MAG TPA: phospho-N-acetylmuramoyl-pentapeptide-transferase, partial [Thermopetrobacter sp.]|nr:phospho-N-acetylmuramoyl-pentapeptide-transferase [Thermopetrobacter sp.]